MNYEETTKRLQELKSHIEFEEMMYQSGEKHPTYNEQVYRGQQNVRDKINSMKEEFATLLVSSKKRNKDTYQGIMRG